MKHKNPEQQSPTKARVFIQTRKRNPNKEYKTPTDAIKNKIENIEKMIAANEGSDKVDQLFSETETSHGSTWLIGRHVKTTKEKNTTKSEYVQQLTLEIKKEVAAEMEEKMNEMEGKMNKKMQENLRRVLKKLGEANPSFNLDIEELCTTNSSEADENGTPVTQPNRTETTNDANTIASS